MFYMELKDKISTYSSIFIIVKLLYRIPATEVYFGSKISVNSKGMVSLLFLILELCTYFRFRYTIQLDYDDKYVFWNYFFLRSEIRYPEKPKWKRWHLYVKNKH